MKKRLFLRVLFWAVGSAPGGGGGVGWGAGVTSLVFHRVKNWLLNFKTGKFGKKRVFRGQGLEG